MADDSLFTQDTVRDFMMSHGGKVTNHMLVTHFKTFLNDSKRKVANRQKFKTFVNVLATVKLDESGEKVLVLKRKYRDVTISAEECSETPVKSKTPCSVKKRKKEGTQGVAEDEKEFTESSQEGTAAAKPPSPEPEDAMAMVTDPEPSIHVPEPAEASEATRLEDFASQEIPQEDAHGPDDFITVSDRLQEMITGQPEACPVETMPEPIAEMEVVREEEESASPRDDALEENLMPLKESLESSGSRKGSVSSDTRKNSVSSDAPMKGSVSSESVERITDSKEDLQSGPASEQPPPEAPMTPVTEPEQETEQEEPAGKASISVKARAQHLNKMESESNLLNASITNKKTPGKQSSHSLDDDDSQSGMTITLDAAGREWLVTSSKANYHELMKLLRENPQLAKMKTALHWAAKHGKSEVVKLLCGNYDVHVNARSHGYTPLHLAAMHGHEEILEILIHTYGADANLRDHSGKKAKQYLSLSASTRAHQLLQARRSHHAQHGLTQNAEGTRPQILRQASHTSKIRNVGHFGISAGSAVRDTWIHSTPDEKSGSAASSPSPSPRMSPRPSPRQSPSLTRKGSLPAIGDTDVDLMPPPARAPPRRKRTSRRNTNKENVSDSELPRASSDSDIELPTKAYSTEFQLNTLV